MTQDTQNAYVLMADPVPSPGITLTPDHSIYINNSEGVTAKIDFNGDTVVYSGELPVDESAKIFFEVVFSYYRKEVK